MAHMTKRERVLAAFEHQETDRVPPYDLMLNDDCVEYFTGVYPPYGEEGARLQAQAVDRMLDMARGVGVAPRQPPTDFTDDPVLLEYARYSSLTYRRHPISSYEAAVAWVKDQVQRLSQWRETTEGQRDHRTNSRSVVTWSVVSGLRRSLPTPRWALSAQLLAIPLSAREC